MGSDEGLFPHFFWMGQDGVVKIDSPVSLTVDVAIDNLHIIDEVVFEVFVFDLFSEEVVNLQRTLLELQQIKPHRN